MMSYLSAHRINQSSHPPLHLVIAERWRLTLLSQTSFSEHRTGSQISQYSKNRAGAPLSTVDCLSFATGTPVVMVRYRFGNGRATCSGCCGRCCDKTGVRTLCRQGISPILQQIWATPRPPQDSDGEERIRCSAETDHDKLPAPTMR